MGSVGDPAVAAQDLNATARPLGRSSVALVAALVALAGIAWLVTVERMRVMDAGPWTDVGSLAFYASVWIVMMAAMMFPSIAPMVVVHARIQGGRVDDRRARRLGLTALFVAGYLVAWTAFGLAAYGLFRLGRSLSIDALS